MSTDYTEKIVLYMNNVTTAFLQTCQYCFVKKGRESVAFITTLPNTRSSLGMSMTSVMNVINVGKQQACKHAS